MSDVSNVLIPISVPYFRQLLAEVVREEITNNQNIRPEPESEKLSTIREAGTFLGLSKPTIYGLIKSGKLKPTYLGQNRLRFQKSDLLAYVNSGR